MTTFDVAQLQPAEDIQSVLKLIDTLRQKTDLPIIISPALAGCSKDDPSDISTWYAAAGNLGISNAEAVYDAAEDSLDSNVIAIPLLCQQAMQLDLSGMSPDELAIGGTDLANIATPVNVTLAYCHLPDQSDPIQPGFYTVFERQSTLLIGGPFLAGNRIGDIASIGLDAGDGQGMREITIDDAFTINYASAGSYDVQIDVRFSDGSTETTWCTFEVTDPEPVATALTDKVVIFAGGFSPSVPQDLQGSTGNITKHLVAAGWTKIGIPDYDHKKASIETNASALIKSLNDYDADTPISKICIMGFSMGGLVIRMAAFLMSRDHPKLYNRLVAMLSIDGPLEGACLGTSTQIFMRFASKKWKQTIPEEKGLDSLPARQMMLLWCDKMNKKDEIPYYVPNTERSKLVATLNSFYPSGKTMVLVSFGSRTAVKQKGIKPGGTTFHWNKGGGTLAYVQLYAMPNKQGEHLGEFYNAKEGFPVEVNATKQSTKYTFDNASGSTSSYNSSIAKKLLDHGGTVRTRIDTQVYIPATSAMGYAGDIHAAMKDHESSNPLTHYFYIGDNLTHNTSHIGGAVGKQIADKILEAP